MFKGRNTGLAHRGANVSLDEYGLKAMVRARMTVRVIDAARRAMSRQVRTVIQLNGYGQVCFSIADMIRPNGVLSIPISPAMFSTRWSSMWTNGPPVEWPWA